MTQHCYEDSAAITNRELSKRLNLRHAIGSGIPNFVHNGEDMMALIDAMRKRGFDLHLDVQCMEMGGSWVEFTNVELSQATRLDLDNYRLAEAVARCALRALEAA